MNRNRLLIGLAFAIVLAFILSAFVYREFKQVQVSASKNTVQMQQMVVAAEALPLGTRLDASKLRTIPWPANAPVAGMFTRIEDCANRAVITSVAENEPILESKLASAQSGAGLSVTIPQGMRAVSVAVNDVVAVAGFVTPGTMVDVLVTGTMGTGTITRTILENVRVLAAGQRVEQDRQGKPETVPVITLLVTPEDAAKLTMASTAGKIQLALRNTIDTETANPPAVLQAALFAGAAPAPPPVPTGKHLAVGKPAPPPPPPSPYVVEVITGSKRETKSFPSAGQSTGETNGQAPQNP
jgi:pilus assembly protein CpaB